MSLKFQYYDYQWTIRAGFPPMGSLERKHPLFADALKTAHPPLARSSTHELISWIVSRLSYLTSGALEQEGTLFSHDIDEFGYKIKIADRSGATAAHGAVVFCKSSVHFSAIDIRTDDFQAIFVNLLTETPNDFFRCEIRVREPESKTFRRYGWDGSALIKQSL